MKGKTFIFLFVSLMLLNVVAGCSRKTDLKGENPHKYWGREAYMLYMKDVLKDPSSPEVIMDAAEYDTIGNDTVVKWAVKFRAKNSFGAYDVDYIGLYTRYAGFGKRAMTHVWEGEKHASMLDMKFYYVGD